MYSAFAWGGNPQGSSLPPSRDQLKMANARLAAAARPRPSLARHRMR